MQVNLEQYVDNVFRFALSLTRDRHLAEDLTQECFLKAHKSKKQLKVAESAKAWLFQMLMNLWKDHVKKKRIHRADQEVETLGSLALPPEQELIQRERCAHVLMMMQSLPSRQRNVLFLHSVEKLRNTEIANLLEINENSVKANLSMARKAMRKRLQQSTTETQK